MTWTTFAAFLVAVALGAMVPGSTTALVIRQSAVHGARAAVPLVMGVEVGLYAWIIASALGVAAVVGASETAYTVLRIVGAAVLIILGIQAWLATRRVSEDTPAESNVLLTTLLLGLLQGVVDGGWFLLGAALVGKARKLFAKAKFRCRLERATGTVLIGLGVRMALSKL
jgi:threonine/homoserine/homoserine lactone efflux protein